MSTVTVRGLSKAFGAVRALDGVDLDVPAGSLTSVLGPSGCGKTTLLRLIAGFVVPDAGEIAFDGRVAVGPGTWTTPQQRRVGYLPQEGALFPHLDVSANVGFGLPRAERTPSRIAELLDLVELPATMASRRPHELSGGQQQRVSLARAMAPRPSLVLLDEPFSALDTALRESTGRAVTRALRAAGATGLLITHDQDEALSLADQVVTLRAGRLVQAASPVETYRRPADAEQARFVGGATVLPGTSVGHDVTTGLGALRALAAHDGDVQVVVRPEQLDLAVCAAVEADGVVADGIAADVVEVSYYGHDAAVRLRTDDGADLLARVTAAEPPAVGDRVGVAVVGDVLTFPLAR